MVEGMPGSFDPDKFADEIAPIEPSKLHELGGDEAPKTENAEDDE